MYLSFNSNKYNNNSFFISIQISNKFIISNFSFFKISNIYWRKNSKRLYKKTNSMLVNSFSSKYFKELTTILKDLSELNQIKDMIILNEKKDKKHIREEIHLFF